MLDIGCVHQAERHEPLCPDGRAAADRHRDALARVPARAAQAPWLVHVGPRPAHPPAGPGDSGAPDGLDHRRPPDGGGPVDPDRQPGPHSPSLLPALDRKRARQQGRDPRNDRGFGGACDPLRQGRARRRRQPCGKRHVRPLDAAIRALRRPRQAQPGLPLRVALHDPGLRAGRPALPRGGPAVGRDLPVRVPARMLAHVRAGRRPDGLRALASQRGHTRDTRPDRQPREREPVHLRRRDGLLPF